MRDGFIGWQLADVIPNEEVADSYVVKRFDGTLVFDAWYSKYYKCWITWDDEEKSLSYFRLLPDVVMWAQIRPQSGDVVEARHTRKRNSWYNAVRVNA